MSSENGTESPQRVSLQPNSDGSRDYGCFQLNNYAHRQFFATHDWSDADQNAAYAYSHIFASRGNWSAWYAVCSPNRVALKSGIWCK